MKYCSTCGAAVERKIPEGDNMERYVCPQCHTIHYQNPNNVTGCIPEWNDKILLCKRAIEPKFGLWTLPAGFMENGETTVEAAAREAFEEANAIVESLTLYSLYSIPHISQVYILFRGNLKDGYASPGMESLEVKLFQEDEIPWDEIAFPVIKQTLLRYFAEKKTGKFTLQVGDIIKE